MHSANHLESNQPGHLSHLAIPGGEQFIADRGWLTVGARLYSNLLFKRQVHRPHNPFFNPEQPTLVPHTRLVHTMFVEQVADRISQRLGLNYLACFAGATGHDIGHIPMGHFGEWWVRLRFKRNLLHEHLGIVLIRDLFELPVTEHTLKCIALHSWSSGVMKRTDVSEECRTVALADKIAYVIVDALETIQLILCGGYDHLPSSSFDSATLLTELEALLQQVYPAYVRFPFAEQRLRPGSEAPLEEILNSIYLDKDLAQYRWEILNAVINAAIAESVEAGKVQFSTSQAAHHFNNLKKWLSKNIYARADDNERQTAVLDGAYAFVSHHFTDYQPLSVFILLDDLQVERAASLMGVTEAHPSFDPHDDVDELKLDIWENCHASLKALKQKPNLDLFAAPEWATPPTD